MLVVSDEPRDEEFLKRDETDKENRPPSTDPTITEVVELSINSVVGLSSPKTMKVTGRIAQQEVVVMIDCGASHNFISVDLVQKIHLPREGTTGYGVLMGTGLMVRGEGVCKGVVLTLQNIEVIADFLPLELGSADVILGMQWLETLGRMHVNWKDLTMKFRVRGVAVSLQGDPELCNSRVSLKAMWKAIKNQGEGVLIELGCMEVPLDPTLTMVPPPVLAVVQQFQDVLGSTPGLSPPRSHDHAITLQPGTAPISVRPYRYPHFQKEEIEKLVQTMLAARII